MITSSGTHRTNNMLMTVRSISMVAFIWFIFMFSGCPSRTVAYLHIVGQRAL